MKAAYALIIISFLVIAVGVFIILRQQPAPPQEEQQTEPALVIPAPKEAGSGQGKLPHLEVMALPGTELWCERMLYVADASWSREDSQTFADHCIYEN